MTVLAVFCDKHFNLPSYSVVEYKRPFDRRRERRETYYRIKAEEEQQRRDEELKKAREEEERLEREQREREEQEYLERKAQLDRQAELQRGEEQPPIPFSVKVRDESERGGELGIFLSLDLSTSISERERAIEEKQKLEANRRLVNTEDAGSGWRRGPPKDEPREVRKEDSQERERGRDDDERSGPWKGGAGECGPMS